MTYHAPDKLDACLERLRVALAEPRTMRYLTTRFGVHRQTMFVWFRRLGSPDNPVRRTISRPAKYWLPEKTA